MSNAVTNIKSTIDCVYVVVSDEKVVWTSVEHSLSVDEAH